MPIVQQYFGYIVTVSLIGGGIRTTRRKPPTCRKSLKTLSHNVVSSTPRLSGIGTHNVSSKDDEGIHSWEEDILPKR
jgi:hypothetical protein